jgi:hypothetical protein
VIGHIAAGATLGGKVQGRGAAGDDPRAGDPAHRADDADADADYAEVLAAMLGDLALVP